MQEVRFFVLIYLETRKLRVGIELDKSLGEIVKALMKRFSSKEGYEAVGDAICTSESYITIQLRR